MGRQKWGAKPGYLPNKSIFLLLNRGSHYILLFAKIVDWLVCYLIRYYQQQFFIYKNL